MREKNLRLASEDLGNNTKHLQYDTFGDFFHVIIELNSKYSIYFLIFTFIVCNRTVSTFFNISPCVCV